LRGQDREGCARALRGLSTRQIFLASGMSPYEQARGFRDRPCEVGGTALGPRGPLALARRVSGALHEAARGDARLHPRNALAVMDGIAPDTGQDRADPGERAPAGEDWGLRRLRGLDASALDSGAPAVVVPAPREVTCAACLARGIGAARRDAGAVGLVGARLAERGHVRLPVRMLAMRQPGRAWAHA
jgi:hypothetical protein